MTKLLQKQPIKIHCPHCNLETSDVWICEINSVIGIRYAYICSTCEKLLGISLQKEKLVIGFQRNRNILTNLNPDC
jgi:DNA-directed RNA polymerase subunit RPC12/RpoP